LYGIWVAPERDSSRARQVLPVSPRASISWTPDGRIVYATSTNGRSDVWTMNADGSARQQLTNNAEQNIDPSVSPDGRYVAFYSTRNGWGDVWRIDIDGSHPLGLTNGLLTWQQSWTPDGKYIFFLNYPDWKIWKVPVDGGAPVQVTDRPSFRPTVSPDGKWLACFHARSNAKVSTGTVYDLAILSLDDKSQRKIFPFRGRRLDVTHSILQWSVDGSAIFYNASVDNVGNIWQQPVDGSEPKQITNFKEADISSFAFSRDARTLACARGTLASDALMIGEIK
jgi:Tol biopolymer transport system component